MNTPEPISLDAARMTRAQRAALPVSAEVVQAIAEQHGVCVRPLAMRRIDTITGRVEVVPVPCGSTREDQCKPCAEKARRLRMAQCRQGWHLEIEPVIERATPGEDHQALMAARADLVAAYAECRARGDEASCEQIADSVAELDTELRSLGVRGRLTPLDPPPKPVTRSTRRRQDAPDLPRRPIEHRTVGRVFAGRYRPSTFLTLTLDTYGRVDNDGAAVNPDTYDYRRAARDAIHFPALLDRFWQNTRRCVGWEVQYFGTVEPQKRGAPHFHAAIRGAIPRAELRAITAATYHQVWWPAHDHLVYSGDRLPIWETRVKGFTDPDTGQPLPTWDEACAELTEPAHVVRFGQQVHVKGILGGTEEAERPWLRGGLTAMGHIEDRWWKVVTDPVTKKRTRVKAARYGAGQRYRVRYLDPQGTERSVSFPDRQKKAAEDFLVKVEGDKRQGAYIDPNAGRLTFGEFVRTWLDSQTFDASTRNSVTWRLNAQIMPFFAKRELGSIRPTDVRAWIRGMQERNIAASYQAGCFAHLSSILSAAMDDKLIRENPCHARTVVRPRPTSQKAVPWSRARVNAMRLALPERYKIVIPLGAGCGLRQGEFFGLAPEDLDREGLTVHVVRQVRIIDGQQVYSLPKRNKTRDVPLPPSVLRLLDEHMERFPPVPVTLPWRIPSGDPVTVRLILTTPEGGPLLRSRFNDRIWAPARRAAGITHPTRQDGTHALRHHYASVLLDAGESIKALSEYLGHHDPGFTLRTYTHLMPNSTARTQRAIDALFGDGEADVDGPMTAQDDDTGL